MTSSKPIIFFIASIICFWVVLDSIWGNKSLDKFLSLLFPFYHGQTKETQAEPKIDTNAHTSSSGKTHGGGGGSF